MTDRYDVIVVGAGNAAFCAALSAAETVKKVLVLERAPEAESGGNSRFTAGLMRVCYGGVEDLKKAIPDLSPEEIERTDFGTYTEEQFLDDMGRLTEYRCDPDLYPGKGNSWRNCRVAATLRRLRLRHDAGKHP